MINKQSTVEIALTIQSENENGIVSPVNLNNVEGLVVVAYNEGNKIVEQWSLISQVGFNIIDITSVGANPVQGRCLIRLEGDNTDKSLLKMLKLEVHVFQNNPNFANNLQHDIVNDIEVEVVKETILKNVLPQ
jgi:hypothetical protein